MSPSRTSRLLALVTAVTGALTATACGGGGASQTAYHNFPDDPTNIYVTGGSQGAIVADDVQVAPGTEGMRIDEIQVFLVAGWEPIEDLQIHFYEYDPDTDLPGQLLGTMDLPLTPAAGELQTLTFDVWTLGARVPASGRFWVGIFIPGGMPHTGWFIAGTQPSVGASGSFMAYQSVGNDAFQLQCPPPLMNLMLTVDVVPEPCPADVNDDNVVEVDDLIEVVLDWGCEGDCAADVNADGVVDVDDVVEVIRAWGVPCPDGGTLPG
ncbi:MAG: hypothetical protein ACYTJ0_17335 [Planctomycetota bacterium]|jgi:hypothetical protein